MTYISGQITNNENYLQDFEDAEKFVRENIDKDVVNPTKLEQKNCKEWVDYMKRDIIELMKCDKIYMIENYIYSEGAWLERELAFRVGIDVIYKHDFKEKQNETETI